YALPILVYVNDEIKFAELTDDFGLVDLVFRVPELSIPEVALPALTSSEWAIDGLAFEGFGAFVTDHDIEASSPAQIEFQSTVYDKEGYKINRPGISIIDLPLLVQAPASEF